MQISSNDAQWALSRPLSGLSVFSKVSLNRFSSKMRNDEPHSDLLLSFFPLVQNEINCERIRHYFIHFFVSNLFLTVHISALNSKDNWCN